jgi:hypothetical protein
MMSGKLLYSEQVNEALPKITISLTNLDNGNYFVQLVNEHSVQTQHFCYFKIETLHFFYTAPPDWWLCFLWWLYQM